LIVLDKMVVTPMTNKVFFVVKTLLITLVSIIFVPFLIAIYATVMAVYDSQ
jgi:hypothetical protein